MKKIGIVFVSIVILLTSVLLVGCKEKGDGFRPVSSISFVSSGESFHLSSSFEWIGTGNPIEISYAEYDKVSYSQRVDTGPNMRMPYYKKTYFIKGEYYYWSARDVLGKWWGYKDKFVKYGRFDYIYVKIIDNETIEIKKNNRSTLYKVTSYSISSYITITE